MTVDRYRPLAAKQAVSQQDLDNAEAGLREAAATISSAKAALEEAKLNLGYCRITAPFDGSITRRLFDVGNLVGDGSASILGTIYKVDPIYAYMNVSETDLLRLKKLAREGKRPSYDKGEEIHFDLGLADEPGLFPHPGILDNSNPSVDATTGTCSFMFQRAN